MALGGDFAPVKKELGAFGIVTQRCQAPGRALAVDAIDREALVGQGNGRGQAGFQRQAAVLLRQLDQCCWQPRNGGSQCAVERQLALHLAIADIQIRFGFQRCAFAGIEEVVAWRIAGSAQQEKAAAAKA